MLEMKVLQSSMQIFEREALMRKTSKASQEE